MTILAHYIRAQTCPNGCPVVVLSDEHGNEIAQAHIRPEGLEAFIADLRMAFQTGEAMQRPAS